MSLSELQQYTHSRRKITSLVYTSGQRASRETQSVCICIYISEGERADGDKIYQDAESIHAYIYITRWSARANKTHFSPQPRNKAEREREPINTHTRAVDRKWNLRLCTANYIYVSCYRTRVPCVVVVCDPADEIIFNSISLLNNGGGFSSSCFLYWVFGRLSDRECISM